MKLFDYSKASAKKAARTLTDADAIQAISFHPSGDYLVVGTEAPILRLYDVNTAQCFVGTQHKDQHKGSITCVKWSQDGRVSKIKISNFEVGEFLLNQLFFFSYMSPAHWTATSRSGMGFPLRWFPPSRLRTTARRLARSLSRETESKVFSIAVIISKCNIIFCA